MVVRLLRGLYLCLLITKPWRVTELILGAIRQSMIDCPLIRSYTMENDEQKQQRRTLGSISVAKFQKLTEWKQFEMASASFSDAKTKLTASKNKFRETLRKHSPALGEIDHLEFLVSPDKRE